MKKLKNILLILFCFLTMLALYWEIIDYHNLHKINVEKRNIPTLLVSGDYGNWLTFGPLSRRYLRYHLSNEVVVVHLTKGNHIKTNKPLNNLKKNTLILVIFSLNKHYQKESKQLSGLMRELLSKYGINEVNLVGHSAGCNVIYRYLTRFYKNQPKKYPKTLKYINMATDYNNYERKLATNFPEHIKVLNIISEMFNWHTDGVIKVINAEEFKNMVGKHDSYSQIVLHGGINNLHYLLHQNPYVDRIIAKFLWQ